METSIGVFGEEVILWLSMLKTSPRRPQAQHVHRQANILLDETKVSMAAQALPVVSAEDGLFVIAAMIDEVAMTLPDLHPIWSQAPLQAMRFMTNNAGVEVFDRLNRVRQGPRSVLATYACIIGVGFMGKYGLPGQDRYFIVQLRQQLSRELQVDADRDVTGGALRPHRYEALPSELLPKEPLLKSIWVGRAIAFFLLLIGGASFGVWASGHFFK